MEIDQILNKIYVLPKHSISAIKESITEIKHRKGHILLRANKTEKSIYFIKKGIVRAYTNQDEKEVTFWFGKEGHAVLSMKSYVENRSGYEDIELLEDCELYELKTKDLESFYDKDIHIANWGRKFAEQELIKTEERLINREFKTALERYKELLNNNPDLIQRVRLGHIASYLGITQVSLSRIRAEVK